MTDVIDLADTVWRTDPRAKHKETPGPGEPADGSETLASVYSVPVYDDAESGQRRITTRIVPIDGVWTQVDFYQFYWADLMEGNRLQHLWIWFSGLVRRPPNEIPQAVWAIRTICMAVALAIGVWGALFAGLTALRLVDHLSWGAFVVLFGTLGLSWRLAYSESHAHQKLPDRRASDASANRLSGALAISAAAFGVAGIAGSWIFQTWPLMTGVSGSVLLAISAAGAAFLLRFLKSIPRPATNDRRRSGKTWLIALAAIVATFASALGASAVLPLGWNWTDGVALALAVGVAATLPLLLFPIRRAAALAMGVLLTVGSLIVSLIVMIGPAGLGGGLLKGDLKAYAGILTGLHTAAFAGVMVLAILIFYLGRRLNDTFLTPVMTDSARMFSNSPESIPNQNRIRKRGMELLNFLHSRTERPYDRVVVLAHSLGTVVAYRLLSHYWGKVFGDLDMHAAKAEAKTVDDAAAALNAAPPGDKEAVLDWRAAVRAYWGALNTAPLPVKVKDDDERILPVIPKAQQRLWRITDFVTIGAPLTYARLLLEESDKDFLKQIKVYRRHPTSPPQPKDQVPTMVGGTASWPIFEKSGWPHHAAMFAATVWTNLYFPPYGLGKGDLVGGKIAGDPPVGLGRGVLDVDLGADNSVEGFTHGNYWLWPANAKQQVSPVQANGPPKAVMHVAAIRDALGLFETGREVDQRLQSPDTAYGDPPMTLDA